jgi:hypothetical protein
VTNGPLNSGFPTLLTRWQTDRVSRLGDYDRPGDFGIGVMTLADSSIRTLTTELDNLHKASVYTPRVQRPK